VTLASVHGRRLDRSRFYRTRGKRLFDVVAAATGLVVLGQQVFQSGQLLVQVGVGEDRGKVVDDAAVGAALGLGALAGIVDDVRVDVGQVHDGKVRVAGSGKPQGLSRQPLEGAVFAHVDHRVGPEAVLYPAVEGQVVMGRGKVEGYCYFLVENKEALTDQAKRRLIALESNSFLGSGAVLAYHDLEIRGGGNLIGESQSGHIKQIGYALYLKMLEDAIRALTSEGTPAKKSVEVKLSVTAYISDALVPHDRVRLELYRRLSACEEPHDVVEIEAEIEDRFGRPDLPTRQFLDLVTIKVLARKKGIERISNYNENITLQYNDGEKAYLKARSRDDDDLLATVLEALRK